MQKFLIATVAAVAMTAGAAQAASITYNDSAALSPTEISGTLSVPGFDNMGGTLILTSVDWKVTGDIDSIITLTNNGADPQNFVASTDSDFFLSSALLSLGAAPQLSLSASTGLQTIAGGGTTAAFPVADTGSVSGSQAGGAGFLLPATVDVGYFTLTGISVTGGGGNLSASQSTQAAIELEVTYNYRTADVPLPAALPLLASAFGVFGVMRIRKARKS